MRGPRIKILPEDLINKIAAGEVVERPASVVKELIENSLDASATKITVEIQNAGRKLIRVSDNGSGMTKEELSLAVQRHSTAKISQLEDLFNIQTLGFRGEALPSIASVSRLEIRSSFNGNDAGNDAGSLLLVEGGKTLKHEDIGSPIGTTIAVKDLFFNTPARKKFLKSPATEMGHIGNIVSKYAMAFPQVAFELISDGKPLLSSPGAGSLKEAVMAVYGIDLLKELLEAEFNFNQGRVYGLISRPTLSRIDKTYENFYVNGRYVRNFLLNRALEEGYRTLIPNNRFPVAILFVDIDPKLIDVNVHPTKREIKFLKTQEVMDAVSSSAKETLSKFSEVRSRDEGVEASLEVGSGKKKEDSIDQLPISPIQTGILTQNLTSNIKDADLVVSAIQPLFPIYQYKDTYIICTDGEDLVLIDQHAAHERIIYDQLSHKFQVSSRQSLLIPVTIELSPKEIAALQENIEYLKTLGFDLEEFGSNSYLLRAVPAVATKVSPKQLLIDIISEIQNLGKSAQMEIKQESIRKLIACHGAIKAGDKLNAPEMNQLIKDLYSTQNPLTCPHGRPTMFRITEEELKKRFSR
ncbi:hypothetical protein AMJ44_08035 [candidate division WOR-1 bacterium DG_54_3]|uniref:DNA mismatch repair protein MutL n=1 Tax=candidate division WOR-1 bacterium DG_54_3 TaxID=1703775 RepID=A0A0S7XW60_UNCSA|nr:MAG: hypothetical protein AMJ44_08035 [candidate division WOR-1 bacterium DG_54_3]